MPVTNTISAQEFGTLLNRGFADLTPAEPPAVNVPYLLMRHRKLLLAFREKGFTPEQIATVLRRPEIGLVVAPNTLGKILKGGTTKKAPVKYTATIPLTVPPPAGSLLE